MVMKTAPPVMKRRSHQSHPLRRSIPSQVATAHYASAPAAVTP